MQTPKHPCRRCLHRLHLGGDKQHGDGWQGWGRGKWMRCLAQSFKSEGTVETTECDIFRNGLWVKKMFLKWHPGKWNQRLKPAVHPSSLTLSHTQMVTSWRPTCATWTGALAQLWGLHGARRFEDLLEGLFNEVPPRRRICWVSLWDVPFSPMMSWLVAKND